MRRLSMLALGLTAALVFNSAAFSQDKDRPAAAKEPSKDEFEKFVKEQIPVLTELSNIFESIKDKASLEKAKPKLDALKKKLDALKAQATKLGRPSDEVRKEVEAKYGEKMKPIIQKLQTEAIRLKDNPDLSSALDVLTGKPAPDKDKPAKDPAPGDK